MRNTAIIFDADGVLLDSLPPHLQICRDKNIEFGLGLEIPDEARFKQMVRAGMKVSPMIDFFKAVGFPELYANLAVTDYNANFQAKYRPSPFPGTENALRILHGMNLPLGIVTSNVMANVSESLGNSIRFFKGNLIITKDIFGEKTKADALGLIAQRIGIAINGLLYIGDQPSDYEESERAGADFLGVSYGWGISREDKRFPVVHAISQIPEFVSTHAK